MAATSCDRQLRGEKLRDPPPQIGSEVALGMGAWPGLRSPSSAREPSHSTHLQGPALEIQDCTQGSRWSAGEPVLQASAAVESGQEWRSGPWAQEQGLPDLTHFHGGPGMWEAPNKHFVG